MIEALAAAGPLTEYADKLMLFGRLVGGWDIEGSHFNLEGQVTKQQRGEWHFGWVLEGRAIQDVILTPPREERRKTGAPADDYGTAIRFYDPRIDAWRVTAVTPVFGAIVNLIARPVGDEIVWRAEPQIINSIAGSSRYHTRHSVDGYVSPMRATWLGR
jgi:hypothetical protein